MNLEMGAIVRLADRVHVYYIDSYRVAPGDMGQIRDIEYTTPSGNKKRPRYVVDFVRTKFRARLLAEELVPLNLLEILALVSDGQVELVDE